MTNWTRRNFIKTAGIAGGTVATLPSFSLNSCKMKTPNNVTGKTKTERKYENINGT